MHYKKLNTPVLNELTFHLESDDRSIVDFNGEA